MTGRIAELDLRHEDDVVLARQRAYVIAELLGLGAQDRSRIATATSEVARNAFTHGGGGRVTFDVDTADPVMLVTVADHGPGIADIPEALSGRSGMGLISSRRLVDGLDITSEPGAGTTVVLRKTLPEGPALDLDTVTTSLRSQRPTSAFDEVRRQNIELGRLLDEVHQRTEELSRVNAELDETNRGVVALYAELEEKADALKKASEQKSRFLSMVNHELRSPLNSILGLARMLLDQQEGAPTSDAAIQAGYILRLAEDLSEMVNSLLDVGKAEAGKLELELSDVDLADLLETLRSGIDTLAPSGVSFVVEPANGRIRTDRRKVEQILRNLLTNAFKYTTDGEVRLSASVAPDGSATTFRVSDTGIGIAASDRDAIFEEFIQVRGDHQRRMKGTGLGLTIVKRFAEALGGSVSVESIEGRGSTFAVTLPTRAAAEKSVRIGTILVIDDSAEFRYLVRKLLEPVAKRVLEASGGTQGILRATAEKPDAIVLDVMMPDSPGDEVLRSLRASSETAPIPVVMTTAAVLSETRSRAIASSGVRLLSKREALDGELLSELLRLTTATGVSSDVR